MTTKEVQLQKLQFFYQLYTQISQFQRETFTALKCVYFEMSGWKISNLYSTEQAARDLRDSCTVWAVTSLEKKLSHCAH